MEELEPTRRLGVLAIVEFVDILEVAVKGKEEFLADLAEPRMACDTLTCKIYASGVTSTSLS